MSLRRALCLVACLLVCGVASAALVLPAGMVREATQPGGAIVTYSVSVAGAGDGGEGRDTETVACTPPSLSLFPIGTTTVSCVGSEGSTGSFTVTVRDTTAPTLTLPQSFTVVTTSSSAVVTYSTSATDLVDGSVAVSCSPASGSTFSVGATTVACSASDSRGNSSSGSFVITVASTPPPPQDNPLDITAEATGPNGAGVTFHVGDDDGDGRPGTGCVPISGSIFPLGVTTVQCPSATFEVTVVDTTPPTLSLPATMTVISAAPVAVSYTASASDLVDGSVSVNCTPASGATFPLGTTTVSCSAADSRGNDASGSFLVSVVTAPPPPFDPNDILAEATGPAGAVITYSTGLDDGGRPVTCSPSSGSTFPLGVTTVTCSNATTFTVTIVDTTPPTLTVPASLELNATNAAGAVGTYSASAIDLVDGVVAVTCAPPSGSTFPLGVTTVTCSASDAASNDASAQFNVTVVDADPPVIHLIVATPNMIWPPNKKLIAVSLTADVDDNVDPAPLVRIFAITCNEPIAAGDAVITGPLTVNLRADRDAHGTGRIYTIWVEAIDAAGNRSTGSVTVTVPHDQGKMRSARS